MVRLAASNKQQPRGELAMQGLAKPRPNLTITQLVGEAEALVRAQPRATAGSNRQKEINGARKLTMNVEASDRAT